MINLIQQLGFPIAMVAYFALRFEKILKANTEALQALIKKIK